MPYSSVPTNAIPTNPIPAHPVPSRPISSHSIPTHLVQALGTSYVNELDSERALRNLMAWVQHNPKYAGLEIAVDEYSDGTLMDEVRWYARTAAAHYVRVDTHG